MLPSARRVLLVDEGQVDESAVVEIANALEIAGYAVRIAVPGESPAEVAIRFRPDVAVITTTPGPPTVEDAVGSVVHRLQADHGLPVVVVGSDAPPVPGPPTPVPSPERLTGAPIVEHLASMLQGTAGEASALEAGDLIVDESGRVALRADEPLDLTRLEFDLLAHFVRNRNKVLSRDALLAAVWRNVAITPNAIEAVVSKLRAKLEEHGPRMIHTVRGVGYVLRVEGTSPFDLRRHALLAERERIIRRRDEVLARREVLRRMRREHAFDGGASAPGGGPHVTPEGDPPGPRA